ncbi:hypothetical protein, partial [Intestinimonas butyriciproducens]|uniref:hypothetical protein n=1 Tax=Intestinimonas butyriciproducens TaxID=1297617 RepID=UPI003467812B
PFFRFAAGPLGSALPKAPNARGVRGSAFVPHGLAGGPGSGLIPFHGLVYRPVDKAIHRLPAGLCMGLDNFFLSLLRCEVYAINVLFLSMVFIFGLSCHAFLLPEAILKYGYFLPYVPSITQNAIVRTIMYYNIRKRERVKAQRRQKGGNPLAVAAGRLPPVLFRMGSPEALCLACLHCRFHLRGGKI